MTAILIIKRKKKEPMKEGVLLLIRKKNLTIYKKTKE